MNSSDSD